MKKLWFILIALLILATPVMAKDVTLAWDASPTAGVTGYLLYYDNDGQEPWEFNKDVGNVLTYTLPGVGPGTWYFTVTAYNANGESVGSNVVNDNLPVFIAPPDNGHTQVDVPAQPGTLTITVHGTVIIQ